MADRVEAFVSEKIEQLVGLPRDRDIPARVIRKELIARSLHLHHDMCVTRFPEVTPGMPRRTYLDCCDENRRAFIVFKKDNG
jgi:hypothetical protein